MTTFWRQKFFVVCGKDLKWIWHVFWRYCPPFFKAWGRRYRLLKAANSVQKNYNLNMGSDIQQPSDVFFSGQRVSTKEGWHFFWVYCKSFFNCVCVYFYTIGWNYFRGAFTYNVFTRYVFEILIRNFRDTIITVFETSFWYRKASRHVAKVCRPHRRVVVFN